MGVDNLAVRLPPHSIIVLDIGHTDGYSYFKQMLEYLVILTLCQMLSKYCYSKKILLIFNYDIRSGVVIKGGLGNMNENEIALFNMIYENDNPDQAVLVAIEVFTAFLEQLEASQELQPACLQESF